MLQPGKVARTDKLVWSDSKTRAETEIIRSTQVLEKVWDTPFTGCLLHHRKMPGLSVALCQKLRGLLAAGMGFSWKAAISHLLANTGHSV